MVARCVGVREGRILGDRLSSVYEFGGVVIARRAVARVHVAPLLRAPAWRGGAHADGRVSIMRPALQVAIVGRHAAAADAREPGAESLAQRGGKQQRRRLS